MVYNEIIICMDTTIQHNITGAVVASVSTNGGLASNTGSSSYYTYGYVRVMAHTGYMCKLVKIIICQHEPKNNTLSITT